jgi:xylulokinase
VDELLLGLDIGTSSSKAVLTRPHGTLVAVGGGARGGLWAQVVSDVTGREQDLPEPGIGASYGDAHVAGTAAGLVPLDARWAKAAGTVRPNAALQSLYDQLYEIYLQLYRATKSLAHRLAEMQLAAPTPTP